MEKKQVKGVSNFINKEWFWSGDSLMATNNDGSFSSSHILTLGDIEPEDDVKNLIAASPEVLDALIELVEVSPCQNGCDENDMTCATSKAKKAIKKAKGE